MARRAYPGQALDTVADGLRRIAEKHGPNAMAFYLSGQLLTEDYYVANKLMKGFIGTAQCRHQFAALHGLGGGRPPARLRRDTVPGCYEDLDEADLIVLVGSQRRLVPSGAVPAHGRAPGRKRGAKIVVDRSAPHRDRRGRRPASGARARHGTRPVHRPAGRIWPTRGALDRRYVARAHGRPRRSAGARARIAPSVARPLLRMRPAPRPTSRVLRTVRRARRASSRCYSQGVNQSAQGIDKVNAIINCHLLTGRIGRPGMGPFSLTGQPNAMGGREVGGLANTLAAHMELRARGRRSRRALLATRPVMAGEPA